MGADPVVLSARLRKAHKRVTELECELRAANERADKLEGELAGEKKRAHDTWLALLDAESAHGALLRDLGTWDGPCCYAGDGTVSAERAVRSMCAAWDEAGRRVGSETAFFAASAVMAVWRFPFADSPADTLKAAADFARSALEAWRRDV